MSVQIRQDGTLTYLTADTLSGTIHCFSTRRGGVSTGVLESLNLGIHRGDAPENVEKNYEILGRAVGFTPAQTVFTRQVHTDHVLRVGRADCGCGLLRPQTQDCDGLITNEPGVALCCFSADCTPILLFDPVRRAVAAIHSGWRGTALGIAKTAVEAMTREFGTNPADLHAAIGPCISRCCFETDRDVPDAMRAALGADAADAITDHHTGKYHVDLKVINRRWLLRAGLPAAQIDTAAQCTACQPELFWSHRKTGAARGSLAGIIMLPE